MCLEILAMHVTRTYFSGPVASDVAPTQNIRMDAPIAIVYQQKKSPRRCVACFKMLFPSSVDIL